MTVDIVFAVCVFNTDLNDNNSVSESYHVYMGILIQNKT